MHTGTPGLLWAYRFGGDGAAEHLADDDAIDIHQDRGDGWLWLHVDLVDRRLHHWLRPGPAVPPEALDAFFAADHGQRIEVSRGCLQGALADVTLDLDRATDRTGLLRFVMTDGLVLSGRRHPLRAMEAVRGEIAGGRRLPLPSALLEAIVGQVANDFDAEKDRLMAELDHVEDAVLAGDLADGGRLLGSVRRTAVRAHRQVGALRTLIHRLERHDVERVGAALHACTTRLAQRLDDLDHEMVETQVRARLLLEEASALLTATTNRNLYALSIITALFLPPALITGIFGMNTKNLPLGDVETGSWWALGLCLLSSAVVYAAMKWLGVLGRNTGVRRR